MSVESRPLPGLFGGISQRIPAMRHPTQCEEQLNMVATTVDGLYSRPGTQHLATLALTGANGASVSGSMGEAYGHTVTRAGGALYDLVLVNGNMMLYDKLTGAAQTVAFPDGKTYLNNAQASKGFACITVADYTFIVNTSVVCAFTPDVSPANPTNVTYINVVASGAEATYTLTVNGVSTTFVDGAPGGTSGAIADVLVTQLAAALGGGYTVTRLANTNIIKVVRAVGNITSCVGYDTYSNKALRVLPAGVATYSDLPARFEAGFVLTINGAVDSAKDSYYVKWDGDKWVEALQPGRRYKFDAATMPHQLYQLVDNTWVFEQVPDWAERKAGDVGTAPAPSFITRTIRDVFFFRNRLGFLSGDSAILSCAGRYFDFWPKTAVEVLDSDPIDLAASVDGVDYLTYAVPFNTNLLVWTNAKQQMVLTGGDVLTPNTARLLPSTSFAAEAGTRPIALGNRAVYAEASGDYAQLSLYRVSQDTVTNKADPLTDHTPRLIPARPRKVAASTTWKGLVVLPEGPSLSFKHLKYELDEGDESMTQKSWSEFTFDTDTTVRFINAHWEGRKLYLLLHYTTPGDVAGGRFASEVMDFQADHTDTGLDYALAVDRRVLLTGGVESGGQTTYTVPFIEGAPVFYRCAIGREPYPLTPVSLTPGAGTSTVVFAGNTTGLSIWAGRPFEQRYTFTEVVLRDANGVPVQAASLKLQGIYVRYVGSSRMYAKVTPYLRETYTYQFGGRVTGLPLHGAELLSLSQGDYRIPVGTSAGRCRVSVESSGPLPVTIPYAEWVGDVTMKARR